jgi:uncharacterized protein YecE (DUF72 family)
VATPRETDYSRNKGRQRLDVFIYFDNDANIYAPFDAQRLAERLGVK